MYEVRVEADFSAAHFLKSYHGKCENLHGHNYKVYAHVRGEKLDEGGMLLDFIKLKSALRDVCKTLDHTNLNDLAIFAQNPSAERIARYIYDEIIKRLESEGVDLRYRDDDTCKNSGDRYGGSQLTMPFLYAIDVFETDTSRARFCVR